jgi:hypothetical protein
LAQLAALRNSLRLGTVSSFNFFRLFPVRGTERVIRSCGYEDYKNPCYKTVLEEYNTYVCTCKDKDGCNTATSTKAGSVAALALTAVMAIAFK